VVIVSRENGFSTVYANLEENPAVSPGDWVETGAVIGTVGSSALSEVSEESHLHFAVRLNGEDRDPMEYLPA
jgi:murein DD-endopeptidase MepM/ murein hydrolase activator NlpD